jgi:hypothetical protein
VFEAGEAAVSAEQSPELLGLLDSLEANLRDEQRALCQQDYITFKQLLTPIQVRMRAFHVSQGLACCTTSVETVACVELVQCHPRIREAGS